MIKIIDLHVHSTNSDGSYSVQELLEMAEKKNINTISFCDHNVVGAAKEPVLKLWKKKLSNPELRNGRSALAKEIIKRFGDVIVDENVKTSLHRYADYKESFTQRIALIKDHNIKHYSGETSIMLGIKIILGLF